MDGLYGTVRVGRYTPTHTRAGGAGDVLEDATAVVSVLAAAVVMLRCWGGMACMRKASRPVCAGGIDVHARCLSRDHLQHGSSCIPCAANGL